VSYQNADEDGKQDGTYDDNNY